jgi:hypothetical protein
MKCAFFEQSSTKERYRQPPPLPKKNRKSLQFAHARTTQARSTHANFTIHFTIYNHFTILQMNFTTSFTIFKLRSTTGQMPSLVTTPIDNTGLILIISL